MRIPRWCLVVAALMAVPAVAAADCSIRSPKDALAHADVVFRGRVREIRHVSGQSATAAQWSGYVVTFDVSRVWKGQVAPVFVLHTGADHDEEPYPWFEPREEFLVFASEHPSPRSPHRGSTPFTYGAHACGGTVSMLRATPYLLWLGAGRPPVHLRPGSPDSRRS